MATRTVISAATAVSVSTNRLANTNYKFISPPSLRLPLHSRPSPMSIRFRSINPRSAASPSLSPSEPQIFISESTKTIASLFSIAFSIARTISSAARGLTRKLISAPSEDEKLVIESLKENLLLGTSPLFFAMIRRSGESLNTPMTVVAAGMAKWLDIYSGVLMIRVLLSWFPNIPWDRQPLSAIRDLCDPYLNLFRNIIPPVFDTLDVSPLLAFAVLGGLATILHST
ncbi:hypothetical protein ZOSMA_58G00970 [Zostera marina]|uniref:YGGT family protein n=1 Tax=Zostera marina TaxID=29655 RepID=A0A0K9NV64_ZOSMR|nr:hypothetical protein ZOSMA_58G00970 [Zostera marina]